MEYKYGDFSQSQIAETKEKMRSQIFFLLLIVDEKTRDNYDVDVNKVFENVLSTFGGLNDLLNYPQEFVSVMSLLDAAYLEYNSDNFRWTKYRKMILDAGNLVLQIKEV